MDKQIEITPLGIDSLRLSIENTPIIRHETYEGLASHLWRIPAAELYDEIEMVGGVNDEGEECEYPFIEIAQTTKEVVGLDGHADTNDGSLHYWADPAIADYVTVLGFFAHELAHLHLESLLFHPDESLRSEQVAEGVSACSCKAYALTSALFAPAEV